MSFHTNNLHRNQRDSESAIIQKFLDAMRSAGVHMDTSSRGGPHPIPDGKIHRADSLNPKGKNKKHVWYVLHLDEPPSGAFGDYKLGIQDTWTGGRDVKELTDEERAKLRQRMKDAQRQRVEEAARLAAKAAETATAMMEASDKASAEHGYLAGKGLPVFLGLYQLTKDVKYEIEDGEPRVARKGWLVVPMFHATEDKAKRVGVQFIRSDGVKLFLKGTPKAGAYHPIGKHQEGADIFIAEGYATAARVHMATGLRCVAAFDSGNLKPVAEAIKRKFPKSRIIIAADNDRFTIKPIENPGKTKGFEAADAVGGVVVWPDFNEGEENKTDFDDLAQLRGLDAVRDAIDRFLRPNERKRETPPPDAPKREASAPLDDPDTFTFEDGNAAPRPLGHDDGICFYWCAARGQVVDISATGHTKGALLALAPLAYWEMNFPGRNGCSWDAAANAMIRMCEREGVFDPSRKIGRGVLMDHNRIVAHLGDHLIVDGKRQSLAMEGSRWIYTRRNTIELPTVEPLDTETAKAFSGLMERLPWTESDMGRLCAGGLTVAPVCGALRWRSHIWITGERGSGKSYLMEEICARVLSHFSVTVQGDTTEAGVRQALKGDLLPILFDEFEAKTDHDRQRIAKVLTLARQASSMNGAPIIKGGAGGNSSSFRVRSAFIFASIDKAGTLPADESRIVSLALRGIDPNESTEERRIRADAFSMLRRDVDAILIPDFGARLFLRTLELLPNIRANAETFAVAIAKITGNRRLGDTLGGPLAGWLSLQTTTCISAETAEERLASWRWLGGAIERGQTEADHDAALSHLMGCSIRMDGNVTRTVGEMISAILAHESCGNDWHAALRRNGIRIELPEEPGGGATLLVSNRHPALQEMFRGRPFTLGTLRQHPAASPHPGTVRFESREKVRALRIDLTMAGMGDA